MVSNARNDKKFKSLATINKKQKVKKVKAVEKIIKTADTEKSNHVAAPQVTIKRISGLSLEEAGKKYPILVNEVMISKIRDVKLNNNQKGRLRTLLKSQLKDTSNVIQPDVINGKIQSLSSAENLGVGTLRKLRILYNMLLQAVVTDNTSEKKENVKEKNAKVGKAKNEKLNKAKKETNEVKNGKTNEEKNVKKEDQVNKAKGPKRYVVFVGNLPTDVETETIMKHFKEFTDHIVNVRIPKQKENSKSAIAYVELKNEHSYEMALSKHHTMLGNRRINVTYTAQKNSKVSKAEAKGKAAKLVAMQKSGQLAGSIPQEKKRSHRRTKAKNAQAKLEAA